VYNPWPTVWPFVAMFVSASFFTSASYFSSFFFYLRLLDFGLLLFPWSIRTFS